MKYQLKCLKTNQLLNDEYTLHHTDNALLQSVYHQPLEVQEAEGLWQFEDWLPVSKANELVAGTLTYKAEALGEELGLSNLWVTFHGYWPEKGGLCPTGSFKDLEAVPTIQRLRDHDVTGVICASAGNTARAFAHYCGLTDTPLIVIVGEEHAQRLWLRKDHPNESVRLVVLKGGDYADAKRVAKHLANRLEEWVLEGGVHNVARRDGMGSLMLDAAFTIGQLPDHYFQGIGGGPGPIGTHEMATRLVDEGVFDGPVPRQHVSQNVEHSPIHNAWQAGRDHLVDGDFPDEEVDVYSDLLLNAAPAYGQAGGVHDILDDSDGQTYVVEQPVAEAAKSLFETTEGIDILPPGAIALASLQEAIEVGEVEEEDCVVLNISGGGTQRLKQDLDTEAVQPWLTVEASRAVDTILARLSA